MNLLKAVTKYALLVSALFAMGCYGKAPIEVGGKFECESDSDCLDKFECKKGLCSEKAKIDTRSKCIDEDGDGFGKAGQPGNNYLECKACKENWGGKKEFCEVDKAPDCDDTDPNINPGMPDVCNGKDDNCDDVVDDNKCNTSEDCAKYDIKLLKIGGEEATFTDQYYWECKKNACVAAYNGVSVNDRYCKVDTADPSKNGYYVK